MEPLQFAYWLQGFAELAGRSPTDMEWESIKQHLGTVFTKITPLIPYFKAPIAYC
jgi:hypothetical protein